MVNKKGIVLGWQWIGSFFFLLLLFVLLIGVGDIIKVEFFEPVTDEVRQMTIDHKGTEDNIYTQKQNEIHNDLENITLPYNLILILITFYIIIISFVDVIQSPKQNMLSLLFNTITGLIILVYLFHIFLVVILDWFNVQVIGALFSDLIRAEAPFYYVIFDNWWMIIIWLMMLNAANKMFGRDISEERGF